MKIFRTLILISSFLILSACNTEVHRITHKSPGDINPDFETSSDETFEAQAQFKKFNQDDLDAVVESGQANEIMTKVILPLKEDIFNINKDIDPNFVQMQSFADLLRVYNLGILSVYKSNPGLLSQNKVLEDYEMMLNYSCDENLQGGCPVVQILRADPSSRSVVKIIASSKEDVFAYYRTLGIAMDLSNRSNDAELNFMYIKRAQEFGKALQAQPERFSQFELTRLSRVFHNTLIDFKGADPNSAEYKEFMDSFNPWEYSRHNSNLFKDSAKHLLDQAARLFMYDGDKLNSSLQETITAIQKDKTNVESPGILAVIEDINSDPNLSRVIGSLGLSTDFPADENYYIIDRLFNDHFTIDEASKIWENTKQDRTAMLKLVRSFVQLQVAYMIIKTNRTMKEFFDNSERYADSFELLRRAVNETLNLHTQWDNLINNRIKRLRTFLDRQFKTFSSRSTIASTDEYLKLDKTFEGLTQNIKYLAVYPNMMMLAYLMAKENFRGVIQTFWGEFTIDPALIITTFLDKGLEPWFSFGNNKIKLNRMQFLYAFHFALTTEIFSTFSNNKRIPIDYKTFFQAIIEKYFQKELSGEQGLEESLSKFTTFTDQKSRAYNDFTRACALERVIQKREEAHFEETGELISLPRNQELHTDIDNLTQYIAMGTLTSNNTYIHLANEAYRGKSAVSKIREIRTTLQKKVLFIEQMIEMVIDYDPTAEADLKPLLESIEETKRKYIAATYYLHQRVDGCGKLFLQREFNLQHMLIRKERQFLGQLYDDILSLRILEEKFNLTSLEATQKAEKVASLRTAYPSVSDWSPLDEASYNSQKTAILNKEVYKLTDPDFPARIREQGFRGKITGNNYEYRLFDLLVRLKGHLSEIYPQLRVNLPDMDSWAALKSPNVQVIRFDQSVAAAERKEDFIRRGLGALVSQVEWFGGKGKTTNNFFLIDKIKYMSELYKISPFELEKDACKEGGDTNKCIRVSANQVIEEAFDTLNFLNLDDLELQNLEWTGLASMHPEQALLEELVMEKTSKRKLPLFEKLFHYITSDTDDYPSTETLWFNEAKEYYETEISLINFFFQPSENIKTKLKQSYTPLTLEYARKGQGFLDALDQFRSKPENRISRFYIRDDNFIDVATEMISVDGNTTEAAKYISETKINEFKGKISLFNDSTEGTYLPVEFGGKNP